MADMGGVAANVLAELTQRPHSLADDVSDSLVMDAKDREAEAAADASGPGTMVRLDALIRTVGPLEGRLLLKTIILEAADTQVRARARARVCVCGVHDDARTLGLIATQCCACACVCCLCLLARGVCCVVCYVCTILGRGESGYHGPGGLRRRVLRQRLWRPSSKQRLHWPVRLSFVVCLSTAAFQCACTWGGGGGGVTNATC